MADITLDRRSFLLGASASLVTTPAAKGFACVPASPKPPRPVFAVGTEGEWDWQLINAETLDEAKAIWVAELDGGSQCEMVEEGEPACDPMSDERCDFCELSARADGYEVEALKGKTKFTDADFARACLGGYCSRCDEQADASDGYIVREDLICSHCMTIEDWKIVNPAHAAELLARSANG